MSKPKSKKKSAKTDRSGLERAVTRTVIVLDEETRRRAQQRRLDELERDNFASIPELDASPSAVKKGAKRGLLDVAEEEEVARKEF
ncbi:hypothetical protein HK104_005055 [Borealophlyctis nickersoniae]|nr:hypothetical protein HK104_005055 [Borealophlyctis nickersoniae]